MHVTIVRLTNDINDRRHYAEDNVFEGNETYFPDGVEEHTGEAMDDDINSVIEWFGDAATSGTSRRKDGTEVRWIEIDKSKVYRLFDKYWKEFRYEIEKMKSVTAEDFALGRDVIADTLRSMDALYRFDWLYMLDDYGSADPVSEWLRWMQRPDEPDVQRYYFQATYDGDQ